MTLVYPVQMPACRSLGSGRFSLLEDWSFSAAGIETTIPSGFHLDFYSVPWLFSLLVPRDQRDNRPSLMHDWLYATVGLRQTLEHTPQIPHRQCDEVLKIAAEQCGLSWIQRRLIMRGLLIGSWRPWLALARAGYSLERPCMGDAPEETSE